MVTTCDKQSSHGHFNLFPASNSRAVTIQYFPKPKLGLNLFGLTLQNCRLTKCGPANLCVTGGFTSLRYSIWAFIREKNRGRSAILQSS
eukprot:g17148.t1